MQNVAPVSVVPAIGLDLGTTGCRLSTWSQRNGKPKNILDESGNTSIPSVVGFHGDDILVGQEALGTVLLHPELGFTGLVDLLRDNPEVKQFSVKTGEEEKQFSAEDLFTHLLIKLKQVAGNHFGKEVTDVVVSVPGDFGDKERQTVKSACGNAGWNALRLMNEAIAACTAYGIGDKYEDETCVLVLDIGGSSLKITVVLVEDGIYEVIHFYKDAAISGNRFDERFAEYLVTTSDQKNKTKLLDNPLVMRRMRSACCKAKECLSASSYTNLVIQNLHKEQDYQNSVTKASFEKVNLDLFQHVIKSIEEALKGAMRSKMEIKHVIMVGGSTKIPKLFELIEDFFKESKIENTIDPRDVVSFGCAKQAMILSGQDQVHLTDLLLLDVEPLSLGLETIDGVMAVMIPRNATIPCKVTQTFTTYYDNQVTMMFRIFEGERYFTNGNSDLGMFELTGIKAERRGLARIDVTFCLDANGILNITALNRVSKKSQTCTLSNFRAFYAEGQSLDEILEIAQENMEADEKMSLCVKAKHSFESFITNLENAIDEERDNIREIIQSRCRGVTELESATPNDYKRKMSELEEVALQYLNEEKITQCKNDRIRFIGGRVIEKVVKSQGLSKGWKKNKTHKKVMVAPSTEIQRTQVTVTPAKDQQGTEPAMDTLIDGVD